ncbi:spermatogenesis-associated protein 1 [Clonorchis sinensis]|uniref:Spermatogenesis-associated protein 1 n=3 Tax=Clonorchis sinensis TaxID=79923 RepID=A0A3R7FY89_CLOSI|nr:spermatogenesis-associated protein 1 [Clonorchis sinensis]
MKMQQQAPEVELHVYIVPPNLWEPSLFTAFPQLIKQTVSAGIIRTKPDLTLDRLRGLLKDQLDPQFLPKDYIFCKSVGHSIGRIRSKQEHLFFTKYFVPPVSEFPELYVLDKKALGTLEDKGWLEAPQQLNIKEQAKIKEPQEDEKSHEQKTNDIAKEGSSSVVVQKSQSRNNGQKSEEAEDKVRFLPPPAFNALKPRPAIPVSDSHQDRDQTMVPPLPAQTQEDGQKLQQKQQHPIQLLIDPMSEMYSPTSTTDFEFLTRAPLSGRPMSMSSPALHSGDAALESISYAIEQQRDILWRLENEQCRRLLEMRAEAEERRRREAEEHERELAEKTEQQRRLECLEEELLRRSEEVRAARDELEAAKELWKTALEAKEDEMRTLRENVELMLANAKGRENAELAAARAELNEVKNELKAMQDRYAEVRAELGRRHQAAEERLEEVSGEMQGLRRKMSMVYHAVTEAPVREQVVIRERKVSEDFLPPPTPAKAKRSVLPLVSVSTSVPLTNGSEHLRLKRLRMAQEQRRVELVKRLNQLYIDLATRRTQVRDEWKRRYYVAKRQAPEIEERMNEHRLRLDDMMRRSIVSIRHYNSDSAEALRLADLMEKRREVTAEEYRLAETMLGLTKAIKLRAQAEDEGQLLMDDLERRRGEVNLVKSTSPRRRVYAFSLSPRRQPVTSESTRVRRLNSDGIPGKKIDSEPSSRKGKRGKSKKAGNISQKSE